MVGLFSTIWWSKMVGVPFVVGLLFAFVVVLTFVSFVIVFVSMVFLTRKLKTSKKGY